MRSIGGLADERPVVFYHQLGCGRSDRPTDRSLWTAERFAEELASVVQALGLTEFHLWGHSWGTALAVLYALTQPRGLLSLTLASPILDVPRYRQDVAHLLAMQPPEVQEALRDKPVDSLEYLAALDRFYHRHLYTAEVWDACTLRAWSAEEFGLDSYRTTVGASELSYTGNFTDRDDSARLDEIRVPTLLTCGRADLATPETSAVYEARLPGSRLVVFEKSSHWYFEEERALYLATLRTFLRQHDDTGGSAGAHAG
jgi:proline iminopeptidase